MIESKQSEHGGVHIVNMNLVFGHVKPRPSVSPIVRPGFAPPPANHMVRAFQRFLFADYLRTSGVLRTAR